MSIEKPKVKENRALIMANWDAAHAKLDSFSSDNQIVNITTTLNRSELEGYLKHNFEILTQNQRDFILASLNAKLSNEKTT